MGTMAYRTSKVIAGLLKTLIGKTKYHIKNMVDFSNGSKDLKLAEESTEADHNLFDQNIFAW